MRKLQPANKERVDKIIDALGVVENDKNRIGIEHMRQFAELLIQCEGMETDKFKNLARSRICISERYVMEYYRSFHSWEVFRVHEKKIVMTDKEENNGKT